MSKRTSDPHAQLRRETPGADGFDPADEDVGAMSAAQHTPGPWTLGQWPGGNVIETGTSNRLFTISPLAAEGRRDHDANARLIAAAPELLAALEAIAAQEHEDVHALDGILKAWAIARAAIAKATRIVRIN